MSGSVGPTKMFINRNVFDPVVNHAQQKKFGAVASRNFLEIPVSQSIIL
jgi:hypothetical protein